MSARRPSLDQTIRSMRRFPVDPAGDEDLASALELTCETHQASADNADWFGRYGRCTGCGSWWPCPTWLGASYAALEWLVAASNAVMRRSGRLGSPAPAERELREVA